MDTQPGWEVAIDDEAQHFGADDDDRSHESAKRVPPDGNEVEDISRQRGEGCRLIVGVDRGGG